MLETVTNMRHYHFPVVVAVFKQVHLICLQGQNIFSAFTTQIERAKYI